MKVGLSALFLKGKTYCYFQVQQVWVWSVKCFVHHMLQDNVKFIKPKPWFSSSSVMIRHGLRKDVVTLFILNRNTQYFTISEGTPKMIFVRNLSARNIFYICYLAYILYWLTLPHNFIQQSIELRFCAGSKLAYGVPVHCNGVNLWR